MESRLALAGSCSHWHVGADGAGAKINQWQIAHTVEREAADCYHGVAAIPISAYSIRGGCVAPYIYQYGQGTYYYVLSESLPVGYHKSIAKAAAIGYWIV